MKPKLPADFVELLTAFGAADVRYLVIGGYAVGYHDRPRTTKDLDLLLDADPDNVRKACAALREFAVPESVLSDLATAEPDEIVWMGRAPLRVDFLQQAPGIDFAAAWDQREVVDWGGAPVNVVGLDDLIASKRAAGREQDLIDAKNLERASKPGRKSGR